MISLGRREVEATGDGRDDAENDAEEEEPAAERREAVLGREDASQGANVTRTSDDALQHPLANGDRDRGEHRGDVRELPELHRIHRVAHPLNGYGWRPIAPAPPATKILVIPVRSMRRPKRSAEQAT